MHRASVITVLNLKGGVGKTHTTWLLAGVSQQQGKRLLAVDTDPQGNLTTSFVTSGDTGPGIEQLFDPATDGDHEGLIRRTALTNIDVIPSNPTLARFDLSDQRQWEAADLHLALTEAVSAWRAVYDFVLFDCPPRLSLVSFAALCASDFVIIPLEAADWGAQGIMQVTTAIHHVQQYFNPKLHLLGYLVSRFKKSRTYQRTYLQELRNHFGTQAFDTVIPDLATFERSVVDRVPVILRSGRSRAAGIARDFFDEVERRILAFQRNGQGRSEQDIQQPASAAA